MTIQQQLENGLSLHRAGRLAEAESIYRGILAVQPNHVSALNLLGALVGQIGQYEAAVELIGRAIQLKPDLVIGYSNLGNYLVGLERIDEAIAAFREAVRLDPDYAAAHNNLGIALDRNRQLDEAAASFRHAIRLQPDFSEAYSNLGNVELGRGRMSEAVACHREAVRLKSTYPTGHSDLLYSLQFDPDGDARAIFEEHLLWTQRHVEPLREFIQSHANTRDPDRRLRIGYVSGDFKQHSVAYFFLPLLEHHQRGAFEIFCYSNVRRLDRVSERMKRSCDVWRDIVQLDDEAAANLVRSDGIDILIDLSGHTSGQRLEVFGRKPAPIQVTYLGYANTTGMTAIDYRLTDALADPPGMTDHLNVEKLWRLPDCAWCYEPQEESPAVQVRSDGPTTFGCFNAFPKINSKIIAIWAELLRRMPESRLLLKSGGGGQGSTRQRIKGQFADHGISSDRIEVLEWIKDSGQHLALYDRVDVALDTFPYHGTTTTCEALWMGVPVVSLAGQAHISRVGVSLLSNVGLGQLIAQSAEQYISIVAALATDLLPLAELRRTLRQRMRESPLMDASRFARNIEAAYRQMWRNWCTERGNPDEGLGMKAFEKQLEAGLSHHRAGRLAEAENSYRKVLALQPNHAKALHLLGVLAAQAGHAGDAEELIRRAVRIRPDFVEALNDLGFVLAAKGQQDEAIGFYRRAIEIKSDFAEAHNNLGFILESKGRHDEAIAACRQAIRIKPEYPEACVNLGNALQSKGQLDDAIGFFRQAIRLQPGLAEAHTNLGNALQGKGLIDEAIGFHRQAVRLKPDLAEAHLNLGIALEAKGELDDAIAAVGQAIRLKPDYAEAHCSLGNALRDTGRFDEAIASYRKAIHFKLDSIELRSGLLFAMNYLPDCDAAEILAEHRAWADRYARPLMNEASSHANERSAERRLRIGYVSADFGRHAVGHFFIPLLENHDRQRVEIFCYANVQHPDDVTERIKRSCETWRNIFGMDDDAAAKRIRSDGIDILVDLSGHTAGNRLRVFARKPAPVQVTYLGYANTTGMSAINYRLTDALADPPGMTDCLNVEKLWRLPVCAWCYQAADDVPEVEMRASGPITFGCFNTFSKINSKMAAIWAELLKRVPESHLLLKSTGAGAASSRQRITAYFAEHGIPDDRIEMVGRIADPRRHLELYRRVDVSLDTFPYHGTTTTCEAMWMGVPVVTLAGRTHVSRVGVSLLNSVGLPELVAQSGEEYISIAAELAKDLPRLAGLRETMRQRMRESPLMDASRFARDIEAAYRQIWRIWCAEAEARNH